MNDFHLKRIINYLYSGKGDLTCLNGGKCENDQCQCSEHFMGHDCSIGKRRIESIDWICYHECSLFRIARCGIMWCSQTGGKCKNKKQCQCLLRYGGPDCSGGNVKKEKNRILIGVCVLVKCNKGASPGLICFNGGTCNNESEICNCRAGYQDQGSGCLLSSFRKIIGLLI
jgi:hypothetical protein